MTKIEFLIAHTSGTDIAQAKVQAETEGGAREMFRILHPDREITTVGIVGVEG